MSFGISHLLEVLKNILSELEKDEVSQSFSVLIGAIQYYAYDFFSVSLEKLEIKNYILTHLKNFVDVLYRYSPMVIITSFKAVVQFFLFLLISIVLLAEVKNIMSYVENLFKKNKNKLSLLLVDVRESIKSTFYSGILVGVAQATLIVLGIIFYVWGWLIFLLTIINLVYVLISRGKIKEFWAFCEEFSNELNIFVKYITFISDDRPFPFKTILKKINN